jgi:hypothetical protein
LRHCIRRNNGTRARKTYGDDKRGRNTNKGSDATAEEAAKGHRPHLAHLCVGMHLGAKKVGTKDGCCKNETGGKNEAFHRPTPTSPAAAPSAKADNWMPNLDRASFDAVRVRRNRESRKKHGARV